MHAHSVTMIRLAVSQRRSAAFYFREHNGAVKKKRPSKIIAQKVIKFVDGYFPNSPASIDHLKKKNIDKYNQCYVKEISDILVYNYDLHRKS